MKNGGNETSDRIILTKTCPIEIVSIAVAALMLTGHPFHGKLMQGGNSRDCRVPNVWRCVLVLQPDPRTGLDIQNRARR